MSDTAESVPTPAAPGVSAALGVLSLLADGGPVSLAELSRELGVAKSTLHRVCAVMRDRGFLVRDDAGRFELGIRAVSIGARSGQLPIVTAFRSVAAELLTRHDETVCLAVLDDDDSVFLALAETSQPVRLVTAVGVRTPAFASASGRAHLAYWEPGRVAALFGGRALVTPVGRRLAGVGELVRILDGVRTDGYAENEEETAVGLWSCAAPVQNASLTVLAALTLCVPTSRAPAARRRELVGDLVDAGRRLSAAVAWLPAYNARSAEPAG